MLQFDGRPVVLFSCLQIFGTRPDQTEQAVRCELSLQSAGGTTVANTIEIGWSVDLGTYRDYQPHLFIFHWINGQPTCYNTGCGFVPVSSTIYGMAVMPGTIASFAMRYYDGNWWTYYNNVPFAYFPGSLWGGAFTSAQVVSAFGEVAADSAPSCAQMGDGVDGTSPGSSSISGYKLYGSADRPNLTVSTTGWSVFVAVACVHRATAITTPLHREGPRRGFLLWHRASSWIWQSQD